MARPKKTLFGFTRKRIFDSLLIRFTGFTVSQNGAPGDTLIFRYSQNVNIEIHNIPEGIMFVKYITGSKDKEIAHFGNRSDINAWIAEAFSGYDYHARRGLFGAQAQKDANYRQRSSQRREVTND